MIRKLLDEFIRYFVGILFIFSGLIKLNDPVGTEIKMEEYFHVFAEDFGSFFSWFGPYSLEIGLLLVVLEIVLGVAVLIRYKMEITTSLLLGLIIFFTLLTFYSFYFNKVTDCGCFGDAIKLTPKQSFIKDVILLVLILHLYYYRKKYTNILYNRESLAVLTVVLAGSVFAGIYAINHLPFIDFRAYKIGNSIPEQMTASASPIFEYTFLEKSSGREIKSSTYLTDTLQYKYLALEQLNKEATTPKITDYAVFTPTGEDVTQQSFEGVKLFVIMSDVTHASTANLSSVAKLVNGLEGKVESWLLTSSPVEVAEQFRHENQLALPVYQADMTVLKTMIRSNPGIMLLRDGVVLNMWHHNDTPEPAEVLEQL